MKILKVEFENINSLKGKWSIDFTDPSYEENHNLFVICGDTGTGKTSILDAITLAIYGRTPRQGLVYNSKEGNEVMTRDTGSCFARVTYKCTKGTFVTEWSQRRSRDRADGNLQNAEGLVYRIEDMDNPIFDGRTGSNGELGSFNFNNIQLDYSQFCRSIMLAQGEFSKFLICTEDERAKILEKLNGSEDYRKIAVKAGEHWSSAKIAKESAENAYSAVSENVLTPEQVVEKTAERDRLQEELNSLETSLVEIGKLLNWYENLEKSKNSLDKVTKNYDEAVKAKCDFAADASVLEKGLRARNCDVAFQRVESLEKDKLNKEGELKQLGARLAALNIELAAAEKSASDAEKAKNAAEAFVRDNAELWKAVRELDSNIKNAYGKVVASSQNVEKLKAEVLQKELEERNLTEKIGTLNTRIANGEKFLTEHAADAEISAVLSGFKTQTTLVREKEKKIAEAAQEIKTLGAKVTDLETSCGNQRTEIENVAAYLKQHAVDEQLPQVIAESRGQVDQLINSEKDRGKCTRDIEEYERNRKTFAVKIQDASKEMECIKQQQLDLFKNDVVALADVIQKHLVEGEACPVCGSREHPSCDGMHRGDVTDGESARAADVASKVRELNEKMTAACESLNKIEGESKLNEQALETAKIALKKASDTYGEMFVKLTQAWSPWGKNVDVATCKNVLNELQKAGDDFAAKFKANTLATEKLQKSEAELELNKSSLSDRQKLWEGLQDELKSLSGEMEKMVSAWITSFRLEDLEVNYKVLNDRSDLYEKSKKAVDNFKGNLETANVNLQNAIANKEGACKRLSDATLELNSAKDEHSKFETSRMEKFGEQNVDSVEKIAHDKMDASKATAKKAADGLTEKRTDANGVKTQMEQRGKDIENDVSELNTARAELDALLSQYGFASIDEYKSASLSADRIAALQKRETEVKDNFVASERSVKDARKAYSECQAEHSDVEDKSVLLQKQADKTARKDEVQKAHIKISGELESNSNQSNNLIVLKQQLEFARAEFERWEVMRGWLGVKNGSEFSTFVQGLTFKSLLKLANHQLHEMKGRYTLVSKGDLNFEIEDTHFDRPRAISNLSGGEKFLVSLSLALGIAEFASRSVKIESLFMDEGFGTLDGDMLESVMDTLRAQRSQGKMLGIITHVESVIDSIDQKIKLTAGRGGHSVITGPGVSRG